MGAIASWHTACQTEQMIAKEMSDPVAESFDYIQQYANENSLTGACSVIYNVMKLVLLGPLWRDMTG